MNIYESLQGPGLSGNIVVADGQSVISHLPLTGYERIEFKVIYARHEYDDFTSYRSSYVYL